MAYEIGDVLGYYRERSGRLMEILKAERNCKFIRPHQHPPCKNMYRVNAGEFAAILREAVGRAQHWTYHSKETATHRFKGDRRHAN